MKAALLLVTWIVVGQQPSSYQVRFESSEACEAARKVISQDAGRIADELLMPNGTPTSPQGFRLETKERPPLAVSALCVVGAD